MLFEIDNCLGKLFQVEYLCPALIARPLAGADRRLNINKQPDFENRFFGRCAAGLYRAGSGNPFPDGLLGIVAFQRAAPGIPVLR